MTAAEQIAVVQRVEAALERATGSERVAWAHALKPRDLRVVIGMAKLLMHLRLEVSKVVTERNLHQSLADLLVGAIGDSELLNDIEEAGIGLEPVFVEQEGGPRHVSGWFATHLDDNLLDRPHRTVREALYHALHPIERVPDENVVVAVE